MRTWLALLAAAVAPVAGPGPEVAAGSAGRPTLVHFILPECACSVRAAPQVDRLRIALGPSIRCVAIVEAEPAVAAEWCRRTGLGFEVLADPDGRRVEAFGVERSLTTLLLDADGRELARWRGHGVSQLVEIATTAARSAGKPAPRLDLTDVPTETVAGCTFPAR